MRQGSTNLLNIVRGVRPDVITIEIERCVARSGSSLSG